MSHKIDNVDEKIGARIRIEREARSWSLTDLAEKSGVSRAMINKVERGQSSPTAMLMARFSGAFGLSMSTLMARAEMQEGRLLRHKDQPVWIDPDSGYIRRHVSPASDLPMDVVHIDLPPKTRVPLPASAYIFLRQLIWVLSGRLTFTEGDITHILEPGDCLELSTPNDCVFANDGNEPCRYAVIVLSKR
ncbi:helix-turn-helix domain-containing protein [Phyllobacterium sp. 628]|uniref:helix-turn-helix domain-containing protein n=1 Tax=Phyllobacterium sp. 628 TaxID=2718938 RepID=UPI00166249EB|nr:XRE family transcriptional regulator [Phyllobacterium sp. 628]QND51838.1 helix-turn-helix domain-containing protein [Phyllobacterium sp. 628]